MCFDDNNLELKAKVESYVTIDDQIQELTEQKKELAPLITP